MCSNGVNASQFKMNIEQIDETVALTRRWVHRAFHLAENAQQPKTAARLKEAQGLLDEVRALLSEAGEGAEEEAANAGVTVVALQEAGQREG
ncbi:MAG: hypothetical protein LBI64_06400 [Coriobacteriales bacterium]|jgi:hypothetical protein|nr:hypothetical protein [Coriobacteriales bacterium]